MKLVKFRFLTVERHVYFADDALAYLPEDPNDANRFYQQLCMQMIADGIFNNESVINFHVAKIVGDENSGYGIACSDGSGFNAQSLTTTKKYPQKIDMVTLDVDQITHAQNIRLFDNPLFLSYNKVLYERSITAFQSGKLTPQYRIPQQVTGEGIEIDIQSISTAEEQALQYIAETNYSDSDYKRELIENKTADFARLKSNYVVLANQLELSKRHLARAIYAAGIEYLNNGLNNKSVNRVKFIDNFNKAFKPFIQVNTIGRITTINELYSDISYINLEAMVKIINDSLLANKDTKELTLNAIAAIPSSQRMLMYSENDKALQTTEKAQSLQEQMQLIINTYNIEVETAKKIKSKPPIKLDASQERKRKKKRRAVAIDSYEDIVEAQKLQGDSSSDELGDTRDTTQIISIPRPTKTQTPLSREREKALNYFKINLTEVRDTIAAQQAVVRKQLETLEGNKKKIADKIKELTNELTSQTDNEHIKREMGSLSKTRIAEIHELLKKHTKEMQEIDKSILRLNELSTNANVEKKISTLNQEIVRLHHECLIEEDLKLVVIDALYAAATEYYNIIMTNFANMELEDQYSKILEFNEKFKPVANLSFDRDDINKKIIPKPLSTIETARGALIGKSFKEIEKIISNGDATNKGILQRCDTSATPLTKSNATKVMLKHLELAKNAYRERYEHTYELYFRDPAFTVDRYDFKWSQSVLGLTSALAEKAQNHRMLVANWFAMPAVDDVSRQIETSNQIQQLITGKVDEAIRANTTTLAQLRDATAKIDAHIKEAAKYKDAILPHTNIIDFNKGRTAKKIKEITALSAQLHVENSQLHEKLLPGLHACIGDQLSLKQPLLDPITDETRRVVYEITELTEKLQSDVYTQADTQAELSYRDGLKQNLLAEFEKLEKLKEKSAQYETLLTAYHDALITQLSFENTVKEAKALIETSLNDANFKYINGHSGYELDIQVKSLYDADADIVRTKSEIKTISDEYLSILKEINLNRDAIAKELNKPLDLTDNANYNNLILQQKALLANLNTVQQTLSAKNLAVRDRITEIRKNHDDAADIKRCKQYIDAIKNLPYWHNHVSFFGGTKVSLDPADKTKKAISVPSGIAKMLKVITDAKLLTNELTDADKARLILSNLKEIAEERGKKNSKFSYSFFHIRDASTDAVYRAILEGKDIPQNVATDMTARSKNNPSR